ncbi:hypothetical protein [Spiroplasma endosymbiont of Thecophora atra]|uniref:hypothetical protein n=1 Tax=Spiroplasma endosymbiont of Thecophora atra TaxID=3066294 RepID=UPI0030CA7ADD
MFDVISDDKNTNFMLYINELYYLREFNEIELKIKNVISKIKLAENIFSSTVKAKL